MKYMFLFFIFAISLTLPTNAAIKWLTNLEDAVEIAKKSDKNIVIKFTGSDWCNPCMLLEQKIFKNEKFAQNNKYIIFVKIDFPRDKSKISQQQSAYNNELARKFAIRGYPTVYFLNQSGQPVAVVNSSYNVNKYNEKLQNLAKKAKAREIALKKAEEYTGLAKAKYLYSLIVGLPENILINFYQKDLKEIMHLDAKDSLKLRKKIEQAKMKAVYDEKLKQHYAGAEKIYRSAKPNLAQLVAFNKKFLQANKDLPTNYKQRVLFSEMGVAMKLKDTQKVLQILDAVIALDSTTEEAKVAEEIKNKIKSSSQNNHYNLNNNG